MEIPSILNEVEQEGQKRYIFHHLSKTCYNYRKMAILKQAVLDERPITVSLLYILNLTNKDENFIK
tara:strand:- start:317 stop:514 length:198 start_codon:yes stop_codon:yes gene_type:complete